jgi:small subunit ribosomal protein S2
MAIDLRQLIKSGVQFGHQTWRWNPKMAAYIWGQKNGIYLIDVSKTAYQLEKASQFLESVAAEGKSILWCGTKKAARKAIEQVAGVTRCPTVTHRWIGGTLTNYIQVKKSVTKLLHLEDVLAKSNDQSHHTKKELSVFSKKVERIDKNVGGIRKLVWPVGALVVVDVKKEHVAIREAQASGVPVVALVDTNSDPSGIDYVIPTNDDAPKAVECIIGILAEAVVRGQKVAAPKKEAASEEITTPSVDEVLAKALGGFEESGDEKKAKPTRAPIRRAPRRPSSDGKK